MWSETVPLAHLRDPAVLRLLAARGLELVAAVRPGQSEAVGRLVRACRDAGVRVLVWPMLGDADGRWASTSNGERFARFAVDLLDALAGARTLPDGLALDLEPPIGRVRRLLRGVPSALVPSASEGSAGLRSVCERARLHELEVLAAIVPLVLADFSLDGGPRRPSPQRQSSPSARPSGAGGGPPTLAVGSVLLGHGNGWQRLLGTPLRGLPVDIVSPMLYSSLAIGYSRGVLRRADVRGLLFACARVCVDQFGARASASLGVAGTGALGDEQLLEGPSQLADDVALCRAAGIEDLALFDLGGVLRRGEPERWLDALLHSTPAIAAPPLTPRARVALHGARLVGGLPQLPAGSLGRMFAAMRAATNR